MSAGVCLSVVDWPLMSSSLNILHDPESSSSEVELRVPSALLFGVKPVISNATVRLPITARQNKSVHGVVVEGVFIDAYVKRNQFVSIISMFPIFQFLLVSLVSSHPRIDVH